MMRDVLSFGYGVATALVVPVLAYGAFGAMVPDGRITFAGIFLACAALVVIPATIAALGFAVGAKAFKGVKNASLFSRGIIAGVIGTIAFVALVVSGVAGYPPRMLGLLVCIFLFAGAAAAYVSRNVR